MNGWNLWNKREPEHEDRLFVTALWFTYPENRHCFSNGIRMSTAISILKFRFFGSKKPKTVVDQSKTAYRTGAQEQSHIRLLRALLFLLFLAFYGVAHPQDSLLAPTRFNNIHIKHRLTRDPITLSRSLTEGKTTDKEKFDAIFTWVVWNIHYNYRLYNSGRANTSLPNIKKILNRRKGICTDFAFTMDTLCELAGIANETVTGYAKEIIFDINDTLYFDNHAWSAVKLNGLWYLYDATWCSGQASYEYTRFSKWRLKCVEKLEKKQKLVTRKLVIESKKDKYCKGETTKTTFKEVDVWILPFVPRVLRNILLSFRLRTKEKQRFVANTTYYLANPEKFAMTHFPNDPIWSLTQKTHNVFEFSADTAYYNRHYTYKSVPPRQGRVCIDCDNYFFSDDVTQEKLTSEASLQNNPNNHLVPANYNLFMAQTVFNSLLDIEDSITKMQLIDSTINYLNTCKEELKNSKMACRAELRFQMDKNKTKKSLLISENKKHRSLATKILSELKKRRVRVISLKRKADYLSQRQKRDYSRFGKEFNKEIKKKNYKDELAQKWKTELQQFNIQSDSLTREIRRIENNFTVNSSNLWGELTDGQKLGPLAHLFNIDARYRVFYLLDNYERPVIEIRKQIDDREDSLYMDIHSKIISVADSVYNDFLFLNNLIKARTATQLKALKTIRALNSVGQMPSDSLENFRNYILEVMAEDICWNRENDELVEEVSKNFRYFIKQSQYFTKVVYRNDNCEIKRFNHFSIHIQRNRTRVLMAIDGNSRQAANLRKQMYDHRRNYLNKLRKM